MMPDVGPLEIRVVPLVALIVLGKEIRGFGQGLKGSDGDEIFLPLDARR